MTDYAFWYRSKQVLFVPRLRCAYHFVQHGVDWILEYHWTDTNHYWHLDENGEWTEPRDDANTEEGCRGTRENNGVCPYLDGPCTHYAAMLSDQSDQLAFLEPTEVMYKWLDPYTRLKVRRGPNFTPWEVIERD